MANWTRSSLTDAGQVLALIEPKSAATRGTLGPLAEWHARLVAAGKLSAAVEFIAHALPRYECIAWTAQAALATGIIDRTDPAVIAVLQWLDDPCDALRRTVADAAEAGAQDPLSLLCQAVFLSGGSIAPEDLAPVHAPADVCAKLAAAALVVGAYSSADPQAALRQIIELGEAAVIGN